MPLVWFWVLALRLAVACKKTNPGLVWKWTYCSAGQLLVVIVVVVLGLLVTINLSNNYDKVLFYEGARPSEAYV